MSGAMRIGVIAENPVESIVKRLGLVPTPLLEVGLSLMLARTVMAAVKLEIFDLLADQPLTAGELSTRAGTHEPATAKLLYALTASGYVRQAGGERYELTPVSRRWLTHREGGLAETMLLQYLHWDWLSHSEEFVRTGKPIAIHDTMDTDAWRHYQHSMREFAVMLGRESARLMPVPPGARDMLDIGGSHGHYSAELCRRHDGLRSVILDLPAAVEQARPILAAEGMGDRVTYRPGNALTEDLGSEQYDLVLVSSLVHHFTDEQNRDLAVRIATALRPGGVYAIQDAFRTPTAEAAGQPAGLLDFFWALTSTSGTWTREQMTSWQRAAGLSPRRAVRFRTAPTPSGIQAAEKPRRDRPGGRI